MTDIEAYKIACDCILAAMKPLTNDAYRTSHNISDMADMVARQDKYRKLAAALMILEGKAKQGRLIP
jgi:hypothetical protein